MFGATSPTLGATKPRSKSTSVTLDLGPTRIDFNLGTTRSEIRSHSLNFEGEKKHKKGG